ncbi:MULTISPECIES: ATP-binding protein [Microbacterium]|uniref:ATP-binding protein n=1 Tax=Microbacterium TaxID=33882 RepID=UPI0013A567F4|nr:ATP-binding protein [Microbacterium sp. KCTC 39802]
MNQLNLSKRVAGRIAYLQGAARSERLVDDAAGELFVPGTRYEFEVGGIGRDDKEPAPPPTDPATWRIPFEGFLAGAYAYRIPVAFRVGTDDVGGGIRVHLGTWSSSPGADERCRRRLEVFMSMLRGLYPRVDLGPARAVSAEADASSGARGLQLVTGFPTPRAPIGGDNTFPIDRLVRAMGPARWSATILAAPEPESVPRSVREALTAEIDLALGEQRAAGIESPIVEQWKELAKPFFDDLVEAASNGAWRTAVFLRADPGLLPVLAAVWRSVHTGGRPIADGIRAMPVDSPRLAQEVTRSWTFPLGRPRAEGGPYAYPYEYQSLLSSRALSAYVHLPTREVPGFHVDVVPRFDAVPVASDGAGSIPLGRVIAGPAGRTGPRDAAVDTLGDPVTVSTEALNRHLFIAGVTGSGKTTTSVNLLRRLDEQRVPFLVIEPVKREYRQLAVELEGDASSATLARAVTILTVGGEDGVPLSINPFEVGPGTTVGEHIDLLRSVFAASFGDMWTPLPQVLELCMLKVYRDRGWDLPTGRNARLGPKDDPALAFPTLADLTGAIDPIIDEFGFDPEARGRVHGSLRSRIDGLRAGSKRAIFETRSPFPVDRLLSGPAVVELERLADASDKAFLIGLLLIRMTEAFRASMRAGSAAVRPGTLRHVLVIEEAHRLLAKATDTTGQGEARRKAVESFSDLLAEVRAYGQGIVVIDQVPTKLAPDVLKNTGTKIAHRTVDREDREALAGAMAMTDAQTLALATLGRGEAAVFGDGDDAPVLARIDPPRSGTPVATPAEPTARAFEPTHWACARTDGGAGQRECTAASDLSESAELRRGVSRIATAATRAPDLAALDGEELRQRLQREVPAGLDGHVLVGCLAARTAERLAEDWGTRRGWTFGDTRAFAETLLPVILTALQPGHAEQDGWLARYQTMTATLMRRIVDPYPHCSRICTGDLAGLCLFRSASEAAIEHEELQSAWLEARNRDAGESAGYRHTWSVAKYTLAGEVVGRGPADDTVRAAARCVAQIALESERPAWPPWLRSEFMDQLILTGDAPATPDPIAPASAVAEGPATAEEAAP